eukprot:TRINITY_DN2294_c0_g1_i3.p1 TRINITY_DN2294_c0_g1~~TRINITY_DN2294_c0_g1_i3.p1  ORF type:complete len:1514 (+),score=290.58 TRINITY_DN2294_c0_g1_i3:54-4595(+)
MAATPAAMAPAAVDVASASAQRVVSPQPSPQRPASSKSVGPQPRLSGAAPFGYLHSATPPAPYHGQRASSAAPAPAPSVGAHGTGAAVSPMKTAAYQGGQPFGSPRSSLTSTPTPTVAAPSPSPFRKANGPGALAPGAGASGARQHGGDSSAPIPSFPAFALQLQLQQQGKQQQGKQHLQQFQQVALQPPQLAATPAASTPQQQQQLLAIQQAIQRAAARPVARTRSAPHHGGGQQQQHAATVLTAARAAASAGADASSVGSGASGGGGGGANAAGASGAVGALTSIRPITAPVAVGIPPPAAARSRSPPAMVAEQATNSPRVSPEIFLLDGSGNKQSANTPDLPRRATSSSGSLSRQRSIDLQQTSASAVFPVGEPPDQLNRSRAALPVSRAISAQSFDDAFVADAGVFGDFAANTIDTSGSYRLVSVDVADVAAIVSPSARSGAALRGRSAEDPEPRGRSAEAAARWRCGFLKVIPTIAGSAKGYILRAVFSTWAGGAWWRRPALTAAVALEGKRMRLTLTSLMAWRLEVERGRSSTKPMANGQIREEADGLAGFELRCNLEAREGRRLSARAAEVVASAATRRRSAETLLRSFLTWRVLCALGEGSRAIGAAERRVAEAEARAEAADRRAHAAERRLAANGANMAAERRSRSPEVTSALGRQLSHGREGSRRRWTNVGSVGRYTLHVDEAVDHVSDRLDKLAACWAGMRLCRAQAQVQLARSFPAWQRAVTLAKASRARAFTLATHFEHSASRECLSAWRWWRYTTFMSPRFTSPARLNGDERFVEAIEETDGSPWGASPSSVKTMGNRASSVTSLRSAAAATLRAANLQCAAAMHRRETCTRRESELRQCFAAWSFATKLEVSSARCSAACVELEAERKAALVTSKERTNELSDMSSRTDMYVVALRHAQQASEEQEINAQRKTDELCEMAARAEMCVLAMHRAERAAAEDKASAEALKARNDLLERQLAVRADEACLASSSTLEYAASAAHKWHHDKVISDDPLPALVRARWNAAFLRRSFNAWHHVMPTFLIHELASVESELRLKSVEEELAAASMRAASVRTERYEVACARAERFAEAEEEELRRIEKARGPSKASVAASSTRSHASPRGSTGTSLRGSTAANALQSQRSNSRRGSMPAGMQLSSPGKSRSSSRRHTMPTIDLSGLSLESPPSAKPREREPKSASKHSEVGVRRAMLAAAVLERALQPAARFLVLLCFLAWRVGPWSRSDLYVQVLTQSHASWWDVVTLRMALNAWRHTARCQGLLRWRWRARGLALLRVVVGTWRLAVFELRGVQGAASSHGHGRRPRVAARPPEEPREAPSQQQQQPQQQPQQRRSARSSTPSDASRLAAAPRAAGQPRTPGRYPPPPSSNSTPMSQPTTAVALAVARESLRRSSSASGAAPSMPSRLSTSSASGRATTRASAEAATLDAETVATLASTCETEAVAYASSTAGTSSRGSGDRRGSFPDPPQSLMPRPAPESRVSLLDLTTPPSASEAMGHFGTD